MVEQFLDVGTGLPSANTVPEVARAVAPQARGVHVDGDPIVPVHAHALPTGTPGTIGHLDVDLRDPATVLRRASAMPDFDRPIALPWRPEPDGPPPGARFSSALCGLGRTP